MSYLVTGHRGFIGTNFYSYLQSKGEDVIGLDYSDRDLCVGYPGMIELFDISVIAHLAAETNVRESIANPTRFFLRNCQSTINMLNYAIKRGCTFIFISSCGAPYSSSPYAASKKAGEAICTAYRDSYGLGVIILRLPNIYGPHSDHKTSVIPQFIKAKLKNKKAKIFGSGEQTRDFVHVLDICEAIYNASSDLTLTTGQLTSINELAELIGCETEHISPLEGEIKSPRSISNIKPKYSLPEGLEETTKWFKQIIK